MSKDLVAEGPASYTDDIFRYDYGEWEEEAEPIEEEIYPQKRVLRYEEAMQKLSVIAKTEAYHSYAYIKISPTDMDLTDINVILRFKYLLFINVSGNKLKVDDLDVLTNMKFIILIQADRNLLKSAALDEMEYLQVLLLNENMIKTCEGINQPLLSTLELRKNKIKAIHFDYPLTLLKTLDLSNNLIKCIKGLDFDSLETLYLAGNQISNISGIDVLFNLKKLHLRGNPIAELNHFSAKMTKLKYLNLRSCKIDSMEEFKNLKVLQSLEVLIITDCPIMEGKEEDETSLMRTELVAMVKSITRVNKEQVSEEERTAADELRQAWEEDEAGE